MQIDNVETDLQVGFTVSTRNFKKAVARNRIKRLMREAYRLQKNPLKEYLHENHKSVAVFFIYTGNEMPEYHFVFEKMNAALQKLEKLVSE